MYYYIRLIRHLATVQLVPAFLSSTRKPLKSDVPIRVQSSAKNVLYNILKVKMFKTLYNVTEKSCRRI